MSDTSGKKQILFRSSTLLTLGSLFVFLLGCGVKHYIRPNTDIGNIKKIAVLPLENFTTDEYASEKIRRTVIIELLSRGIDVIEPGEVISTLSELRVRSLGSITLGDIGDLGEILNVGSVMMGSVDTFRTSRGISVSYPDVSINLRLFDVTSGNIVWSVSNTSGGASFWTRHFGAEGATLDETARKVVKEALDTLH